MLFNESLVLLGKAVIGNQTVQSVLLKKDERVFRLA